MFCTYKGYDSGYESEEESDEEDIEDIQVDEEPRKQAPMLKGILRKLGHQNTYRSNKSIMFNEHITFCKFQKELLMGANPRKSKVPPSGISKEYRNKIKNKLSEELPSTPS